MKQEYVIRKGNRYYRWDDSINDVVWGSLTEAIRWTNKRDTAQVAAANGGKVQPVKKGGR